MEPSNTSAPAAPWRNPLVLAIAGIALVVGLVAGFFIGFQVEKSRVKDDVNRLRDKVENLRGRLEGGALRQNAPVDGNLVSFTNRRGEIVTIELGVPASA